MSKIPNIRTGGVHFIEKAKPEGGETVHQVLVARYKNIKTAFSIPKAKNNEWFWASSDAPETFHGPFKKGGEALIDAAKTIQGKDFNPDGCTPILEVTNETLH